MLVYLNNPPVIFNTAYTAYILKEDYIEGEINIPGISIFDSHFIKHEHAFPGDRALRDSTFQELIVKLGAEPYVRPPNVTVFHDQIPIAVSPVIMKDEITTFSTYGIDKAGRTTEN